MQFTKLSPICPICNKPRSGKSHTACSKIMQKKAIEAKERAIKASKRRAQHKYAANNPEKIKEKDRNRIRNLSEEQREKARQAYKRWYVIDGNKEKTLIHSQNRRARKKQNGGVLTKGLQGRLYVLQKGKCACCNVDLGDKYHMDHIIPLAKNGKNEDSNIQLLCPLCNMSKGSKHPIDFMQSRGYLL